MHLFMLIKIVLLDSVRDLLQSVVMKTNILMSLKLTDNKEIKKKNNNNGDF